jgi:hypothetical protein
MRDDVMAYIQGDTTDTELQTLTRRALNNAIDKVNSRRWKKLIKTATITLADDTAVYTTSEGFPSDFKEPGMLLRLNSSSEREGRIPYKEVVSMTIERPRATVPGTPRYYTIDYASSELELEVPASAAFVAKYPTLQFYYYPRLARLSGDADTIATPVTYEWFFVTHAAATLAAQRGHQVLNFVASQSIDAWRELVKDDNDTQTDWSEPWD